MSDFKGTDFWQGRVVLSAAAAQMHNAEALTNPYDQSPLDLTIFVSCYNEAEHIIRTLHSVCDAAEQVGLKYEIIVIDDCSKDSSAQLVADFIKSHPERRILLRANAVNKGLAHNYVDAAFLGVGKYYRLVCGDNSEPTATMVSVLSAIGQADIIVPYYLSIEGKGRRRQMISRAYTCIVNFITGNRLNYYNGLAVHLRYNVLRWHSDTMGFGFQAEILCILLDRGFTYKEVPVVAIEQRIGKSNALTFRNLLSVAHTLSEITNRRIRRFLYGR